MSDTVEYRKMTTLREALLLKGGGVVSIVGAGGKTSLMFRLARELAAEGDAVLTTTTTKILRPGADQSSQIILSDSLPRIIDPSKTCLKKDLHVTAASSGKGIGKLVGLQPEMIDEICRSGVFRWILVEADGASMMPLKAPAAHEPVIPGSTDLIVGVVGLDAVGRPLAAPYVFRPKRYVDVTGISPGDNVTEDSVAAILTDERGIMKGGPPDASRIVFLNKADSLERIRAGRKIADLLKKKNRGGVARVVIGAILETLPIVACRDL